MVTLVGQDLFQQGQRVAVGAVGGAGDQRDGGRVGAQPSALSTSVNRKAICATEPRLNSNTWQRDWIVIGILSWSVVARINKTRSGGSSSVFRKASLASLVS